MVRNANVHVCILLFYMRNKGYLGAWKPTPNSSIIPGSNSTKSQLVWLFFAKQMEDVRVMSPRTESKPKCLLFFCIYLAGDARVDIYKTTFIYEKI